MKTIFTHLNKLTLFLIFSYFCISIAVAQTAPVVFPYNGFEIDGDLKANTPTTNVGDWIPGTGGSGQNVFNLDGTAINTATTYRFTDLYNSTGDNTFTGGGKFNDDPNTLWSWTNSKAGGKGDINNVLIHLASDIINNQWLIIASDRLDNTGTSYIDFEFFQNTLTANAGGSFTLSGGRTVGDILLSVEYSNGGSIATVKFYKWSGTDYVLVVDPSTNAFGQTNTNLVDTFTGGAFGSSQYSNYQFVEAAINISAFFAINDPCAGAQFGSVLIKTKSSNAPSASLNDFAGPYPVKLVLGTASISYGNGNFCKNEGLVDVTFSGVTGGTYSASSSGLSINPTTGQINVAASTAGTYTVTYSFSTGGCPKSVTTQVNINSLPIASIGSVVNATCKGGASGSATASATEGTPGYTYSWNTTPVQNTATATGLAAGTYTVTVTDSKGCTDTEQITITEPAVLAATVAKTNVTCNGSNDGTITVTAPTGGYGTYEYRLDSGTWQTSGNFTNLANATYSVQIRDAANVTCVITLGNQTITQPSALGATVNKTNVTCNSASNGTITITSPTGGYGTYEYRLDSGAWQASGNFTGLAPATYSVQIRDAANVGCVIILGNQTITQPTTLSATVTNTNVTCNGANNGTITVSAPTGGYGTYEYRLDSGTWQTSGSFTGLAPATYSIQIRDAANIACAITLGDKTITQPNVLAATVAKTNVTCNGANNGTITVSSPTGGYGTYEYRLNTGTWQTSGSFTGLAPNTYSVQIRDAANTACTITLGDQIITQPNVLSATVAKTDVTCNGANNGTITVSIPTGGYGTYEYRLNTGTWQTSGNFTALAPATYSVQIRDAANTACTITLGSQIITQPAVLNATVAKTDVTCNGANNGTITVSSPTGGYGTYEYRLGSGTWQASGSFTALAPNTYSVQIRDAANTACTITLGSQIITQPAVLNATVAKTNVTCNGSSDGTITVTVPTGGYGTYEYRLDSGTWQTSGSFIGLAPATYSVQIRDAANVGCTIALGNQTITQPAVLNATVAKTDVTCNGANNGTITVTVPTGGYGTYQYRLDSGTWQASGIFTGLAPATYSVQIRDAANTACTITLGNQTITQPNVLSATVAKTDVTCNGANNGTITVTSPTGGYGTYQYRLNSGTWQSSGTFTGLAPNIYSVQIRDAANTACTITLGNQTITQPAVLSATVAKTNVTCNAANDGTITVSNPTGGYGTFEYRLGSGTWQTSGNFTGLAPATYSVQIRDAANVTCTIALGNQTITQPAVLNASVAKTNVTCNEANNGTITVTSPTGGYGTYEYRLDSGAWQASGSFTGLAPATYSVQIRDAANVGCTITLGSQTITQPNVLSATVAKTDVTCNGANNGTITVSAPTGGYGTYQYRLNSGTWQSSGNFTGLAPNTYSVQIRDAANTACTIVLGDQIITQPNVLAATVAKTNVTCNAANDGTITVTNPTGGYGTFEYRLGSGTWQTSGSFTGLAPATYSVQIRDAANVTCTITLGNQVITQPNVLAATVSKTNVTCNSANDGTITVTSPTGGYGTYEYRLGSGAWQTSGNFTGLAPATYSVQIRDAANVGCTITLGNQIITQPNTLSASVAKTDVTCNGANNGIITVSAPIGGYGTYEYRLNTGTWQSSGNFISLAPATYSVQIRDAANIACTITLGNQIISQPAVLSCSITPNKPVSSNGLSDGQATVTPVGGNGGYTYLWDNGETTAKAVQLNEGLHTVTVTDSKGCTTTCSITVTQPEVLSCNVVQDSPVKCFGDSNGTATVTAHGGNFGYTYLWDNGETTAKALALNVGLHTVTVTDALGYKTTCTVTIEQPAAALSATAVIVNNNNCTSCHNGSINLTVTGGTTPYTFLWSNQAITEDLSNLTNGTYSVEITDARGCKANYTFTISESSINVTKDGSYVDNNHDGITNVGDLVTYNFVVKNTGTVDLTNVTITDNNASITGGPIALLAAGATDSNTFSGSHIITQADINTGFVYNLALATAKDPENKTVTDNSSDPTPCTTCPINPDCPDCTITELNQSPSINLTKDGTYVDSNNDGITNVGDVVTYNFVVKNTGNVTLTNVTITDNNAVISGGPIATLAVGATDSTTFSGSHAITQDDIDAGLVYNLATVVAKDPKNNPVTDTSSDPTPCSTCPIKPDCPDCTITPLTQTPKIVLVKNNNITVGENGCATLKVGDMVTYTFTVTNPGNVSLHNISVVDPHLGLSAIALESGDSNTNNILELNETWVYKATYTVTQSDIDNGKITNQASVSGTSPKDIIVTDQSGNTSTDNNPNVITICTNSGIALVKNNNITVGENGCAALKVGDVVTYTFTVTNPGNVSLHNITVNDPHAGLSAIALESGDSNTNNILEVNETWIYKATYTVAQADIDAGKITNQASANGKAPDESIVTDQSGNTSTDNNPNVITICTNPGIALVKTNNITVGENGCATLKVGDVVTYTFTVTNPGNVSLHNIILADPHPGLSAIALESGDSNTNSILEVGETWIYKATYTVTQADIDNGKITNQALVNGKAPNETIVTDQSGNTSTDNNPNVITICTNPDIALVKTNNITVGENGCATLKVGDVVTYTFTVTNPGNVSLHNIILTDPHPGLSAIALESGDSNTNSILEVSETWVYKATYTVTQADIDNGKIINQASVNGKAPNETIVKDESGNTPSNNDPNVIVFCINPGLTVVKTATTNSFSVVGDIIHYTITVKNTGNTTLNQITVKDPLTGLNTVIATLAPGGSSDYTQSYTVTQDDLNKGSVTNVAKADGFTPDGTPISGTDDEIVNEKVNVIDAVDDNAGTVVGVNVITPNVINIFKNDTLNGLAVNPADLILTTVTANPFLQMNADGSIDVLPNAPVGTQTLVYQICEKANNTNCDSATVTVNIEAPSMTVSGQGICINDVPYFSYTTTANNFTPLNGLTITWKDKNGNVVATMNNLPLNGKVLWPGAVVDQNGNGIDWPGWLLLPNGKWIEGADGFEGLRPTASVTLTMNPSETLVINYPPSDPFCTSRPTFRIDAVDDNASTLEGLKGVKNVVDVFKNDTLNTVALNPADVTLTVLVPDPKGGITLNADGTVDVKANTPTGTYTLTYQICEKADAGNCDSAIVTVNVTNIPLPIIANPDTYSVTQCSFGDAVRNALSNDLLNGVTPSLADFKFKLLSVAGQNIQVDNNGNVSFSNGVAAGQFVLNYQVCETANPTNCSTSTITINIAGIEPVTITGASYCNADTTPVDLNSLLPQGTPLTGTWVDTENTGGLTGSTLNALGIPIGTYKYEYKIAGDCPRSIFLTLSINDDCKVLPCRTIVVHNALSSTEDGRNDYFQIEGIEDNACYKNIRVEIYNRWGVLVFEKDNYNNEGNAFRGKSEGRTTINKNEGLPTGTYFYILSYDSDDNLGNKVRIKKDGFLYLVK